MTEPVADLDDFFAKKDRKKSKKKFPAVPAELTALTTSIPAPKKVEPAPPTTTTTTQDAKEDEGNEWLDYKEEQEKDYSGLKLRQLEEALPEPEEEDDQNQEENTAPAEPAWKAVDTPAPAPAPAAAAVRDDTPKAYISPALRNASVLAPTRLGKASKAAPDLANDTYFPALGAEPPKPVVQGKLQPSRLGPQRSAWGQPAQQQGVSLGNRFNTLDNEDS